MARLAIVFIVTLLVAQTVAAAPSFLGFTGLLRVPDADTLNLNEFNLAWFNVDLTDGDETAYAANMGLRDNLEIGVLRTRVELAESETVLNAKYRIRPETEAHAAVAVGVLDPTDEIESTVYVVASKVVAGRARVFDGEVTGLRAHIGGAGGALDGIFLAASAALGDRLFLIAEYDTADVNLGARLNIGYGFRAHAAWLNDLDDLGLGVSYNKMF
ncbi:MAG: hypothetical protein JSV65_18155 [Armatimonadota bacterium]|nr:MAG: hypothetical protein JSV65_18155 [Armatimonadota bacterium]